ncbi:MAG: SDR family NAD(P)-dependent oxidoreductase [Nitriliruptorales bacterium]|nr:SDR family NAD(P)-dependent oxidoreductase [Nitriliruptorales bacterium]
MVEPAQERPRTAVVAGGGGALGSAVVDLLLERGECVAVPYIVDAEAERLRQRHADAVRDGRLRLSEVDVADGDALAAHLDVVAADWGPLWLACSVAGGWTGGVNVEDLDDLSLLDLQLRLNLRTAVVTAREGLRHMGPAGGRVVVVASRTVRYPAAGQAAYTASKAGVIALVETLAQELRGTGRTANAVVPKVIDTPANRQAMPDADHRRWVPPTAIAEVILWLASPAAWPVSGAAVPVYGDS